MNTLTTMKHKFIARENLVTAYLSWEDGVAPLIPRILTKLPTIFKEYISNFENYSFVWNIELNNDWVLKISYLKSTTEDGKEDFKNVLKATFLISVDSEDGYITYGEFKNFC